MKKNFLTAFTAIAIVGLINLSHANAQVSNVPAANPPAAHDMKTMGNHNMMGKMDMAQMHMMMGDCMKMHNDGKMCDKDTMAKCQENMAKGECQKMMKHTKAQSKTKTK